MKLQLTAVRVGEHAERVRIAGPRAGKGGLTHHRILARADRRSAQNDGREAFRLACGRCLNGRQHQTTTETLAMSTPEPERVPQTSDGLDVPRVFERVAHWLLEAHPGDQRGRMLHAVSLKTAGRSYAFTTQHDIVVKLPAGRVSELVAAGVGRACDPRGGRPMRQWIRLSRTDEAGLTAYVIEARDFVAGRQPHGEEPL